MDKNDKLQILKNAIKSYPDFPEPGIIFRDIFSAFNNIVALRAMKDLIMEHILFLEVDLVVGLDSRGFLFGPIICMELGKPFLPVRKKGKLPGKVTQQKYTLEYGEATFELQTEFINEGTRVLIVDDLLATGVIVTEKTTILLRYLHQQWDKKNADRKREFLSTNGDSQDDASTVRSKRPRLDLNNSL
ncbi:Adenine phosphoribosyltransferase [Trachymyrmex zeteki]|uniref:adenine phosphoribosyltransferase n=1 Tax=Mycetomoellerius zeteki TaxID=64791 RepID=A0A151WX75_9HYME|nr:Adenine phosphoribosyltransferase [Trachymyrmex zeteki]